jgi:chemotaxis protein MotB
MNKTRTLATALASTALLFLGSCASQKTLTQYQDEVRTLREERTQLKKENRDLRTQNEALEISIADASMPLAQPQTTAQNPELDALGIGYGMKNGNYVISIPSEVTFPSGKADLTKTGKGALRTVSRILMDEHMGNRFWIEGHTDSDPIRKSKWASNRDLSVERAMAVLHFLVEQCEVPDDQCVVAGHGQYEPLAGNSDKAGKARNRRVEIVVHER